jgi:hypothetical protein
MAVSNRSPGEAGGRNASSLEVSSLEASSLEVSSLEVSSLEVSSLGERGNDGASLMAASRGGSALSLARRAAG